MAHSPAVLAAYTSLRAVIARARHLGSEGELGTKSRYCGHGRQRLHDWYRQSIRPHERSWTEEQIAALRTGTTTGDTKIDALTGVIREAAANSGNVTEVAWEAAQQGDWSDAQLAEAFAQLRLTMFTGYFLNYAQTEPDV